MIIAVILVIGLFFISPMPVSGQNTPCVMPRMDQVDALLKAKVVQAQGAFNFQYRLENRAGAAQPVASFAVQAFTADGSVLTQRSPSPWEAGGQIPDTQFYVWNVYDGGLAAGSSVEGFGFANASLPAIVDFLAWNDVEPPSFPEGTAPDACQGDNILENSFKGKAVGPKPPPANFVPLEFLNYLITLLYDSRQLGWIKVDGVHQSLLAKLLEAKRALEKDQSGVAKNTLNAFLNEVRAASCQEFSCPGNKPLTSEAYALLFFNGQFLVDKLP